MSHEQQLIEAGMRYQLELERAGLVNIKEFVQDYPADIQQELRDFLEFSLAIGQPMEPIVLTPEEREMARRAIERSQARDRQRRRQAILDAAATAAGYENWTKLETAVINGARIAVRDAG